MELQQRIMQELSDMRLRMDREEARHERSVSDAQVLQQRTIQRLDQISLRIDSLERRMNEDEDQDERRPRRRHLSPQAPSTGSSPGQP